MVLPCPEALTHRVEVLDAGGFKCPCHSLGCGHAGYGMAIANGLAHGDDVGDKVFSLQLEGPEVLAHSAKAHLNLVCDKDPSGPVDVPVAEDRRLMGSAIRRIGPRAGGSWTLNPGSASTKVGASGRWLHFSEPPLLEILAKRLR